jgi:deoxyribonucleoside regulator
MDEEKDKLSIEAAELYYQLNYSQQQIANRLEVSRPTVSRLLQYAKDKGYVQIKVSDPFMDLESLKEKLSAKYQLKEVIVVYSPTDEYSSIKHYISMKAAEYLNSVVMDGTIIGVSWGSTIYEVARNLQMRPLKGVEVVQLKGGISFSNVKSYAWETLTLFANAFHTLPKYLPLPLVFDNPNISEMVMQDRHIKHIMEIGKEAHVAIFTVGSVNDNALLFRLGYFSEGEKKRLKEMAVGDVCSRFIDQNGRICDENINRRTVSIELEELRKKDRSILVAGGIQKAGAIHAALSAGYANVFITDQHTAKQLLSL